MADRIRLLPEVVANQIAAGEVVNRPASVVKEMMENAIDAGARSVKVNFRDGGKELIQIVDDGCGMSPMDARMAFDRHATSKIRDVEDIYALTTFGFRGEALASIAAVAQVELRTRQEGDETGTVTEINGGQFAAQRPVMCPVGSQFFVRNLFYNVPARRRFLEKSTTSSAQIRSEFQRVALCNPGIAFELYSNDAPLYSLGATTLAGRIVDVVGRGIKHNLLEVGADTSIASVAGFIGRPAAAKRRNSDQYLFVNGRYFKSAYLVSAVMKAYEKLMPEGCQPSYFLYLTVDPERIDVNVHPQKTEVKFADEAAVWQIVNAAVRETLAKTGAVPMMDFDREDSVEIPVLDRSAVYSEPRAMSNSDYNPFRAEYVDASAPDPNVDFAGFDIPGAADRTVADGGVGLYDASADLRRPSGRGVRGAYIPEGFASEAGGFGAARTGTDDFAEISSAAFGDNVGGGAVDGNGFGAGGSAGDGFGGCIPADDDFVSGAASGAGFGAGVAGNAPIVGDEGFEEFVSAAGPAEEESALDFIPSAASGVSEPRLDMSVGESFSGALPLGNGLVATLFGGRFAVVDVRRARERVLYEEYLRLLGHGAAVSQQLLFAERLELSADEYALVEEHAVELAALGFDLDLQGDNVVEVKGTPADLPADTVDKLVYELLQAFALPVSVTDTRRERVAAVMARNAARGTLRSISPEEATALFERLRATGNCSFTPSGKAIMAFIPLDELRGKLG